MTLKPKSGLSRRAFIHTTAAFAGGSALVACGDGSDGDDPLADTGVNDVGDGGADTSTDAGTDTMTDVGGGDTVSDTGTDTAADVGDAGPPVVATTITFVHVNDLHGAFNPDPTYGSPAARLRGFYKSVLEENPNTLFTNGGDDFEKGTVIEPLTGGQAVLEFARAMKFDVRCIGNHDFAWSRDLLLEYSNDDHADVICSNVEYTGDTGVWGAQVSVIREVDGIRIGFFGMVGKPWNERNQQYDGDFYEGMPMTHDYVARAQELVAELRGQVDLLVMISHLGYPIDILVANQVDGIDVILGAHTHTVLTDEFMASGTIIVQAGSSAAFASRLDLDFDADGRLIDHRHELFTNVGDALPLDEETNDAIVEIIERLAPGALEPVGRLSALLDDFETSELAARAAVSAYSLNAALIDVGTAWTSLPPGELTQQHLIDVFKVERQPSGTPGFNSLYRTTMTGASLRLLATMDASTWRSVIPSMLEDSAEYTVGVQKHVAFNPGVYLPEGAEIGAIEEIDEMFVVIAEYARQRSALCLYVDVDTAIDECMAV
jgi:2',3'-cyclic-nucleotide 2'-phosphodiesterase (5'-nucleotidase family)